MTNLEKYIIARYMYSIGEEGNFMNDSEYRVLEDKIKVLHPESVYLTRSWSSDTCPVELLDKYEMSQYIQNIKLLHKSESIPSINTREDLEKELGGLAEEGRLSFKDDGFNVVTHYYNGEYVSANLRGRLTEGFTEIDTMKNIVPRNISMMGKVRITGELTISNKKWKLYELETGNRSQRSSVSTAISRGDTGVLNYNAFKIETDSILPIEDSYVQLKEWGFNTPAFVKVTGYQSLLKGIALMSRRNSVYVAPTDGLVLETSKTQVAIRLGAWEEEMLMSYIEAYEETRGMHGTSINLIIKPVRLEDKDIKRVTVNNIANIVEGDLRIGSPVAFTLKSGVIGVYNSVLTEDLKRRNMDHVRFRDTIDSRE